MSSSCNQTTINLSSKNVVSVSKPVTNQMTDFRNYNFSNQSLLHRSRTSNGKRILSTLVPPRTYKILRNNSKLATQKHSKRNLRGKYFTPDTETLDFMKYAVKKCCKTNSQFDKQTFKNNKEISDKWRQPTNRKKFIIAISGSSTNINAGFDVNTCSGSKPTKHLVGYKTKSERFCSNEAVKTVLLRPITANFSNQSSHKKGLSKTCSTYTVAAKTKIAANRHGIFFVPRYKPEKPRTENQDSALNVQFRSNNRFPNTINDELNRANNSSIYNREYVAVDKHGITTISNKLFVSSISEHQQNIVTATNSSTNNTVESSFNILSTNNLSSSSMFSINTHESQYSNIMTNQSAVSEEHVLDEFLDELNIANYPTIRSISCSVHLFKSCEPLSECKTSIFYSCLYQPNSDLIFHCKSEDITNNNKCIYSITPLDNILITCTTLGQKVLSFTSQCSSNQSVQDIIEPFIYHQKSSPTIRNRFLPWCAKECEKGIAFETSSNVGIQLPNEIFLPTKISDVAIAVQNDDKSVGLENAEKLFSTMSLITQVSKMKHNRHKKIYNIEVEQKPIKEIYHIDDNGNYDEAKVSCCNTKTNKSFVQNSHQSGNLHAVQLINSMTHEEQVDDELSCAPDESITTKRNHAVRVVSTLEAIEKHNHGTCIFCLYNSATYGMHFEFLCLASVNNIAHIHTLSYICMSITSHTYTHSHMYVCQ